MKALDSLNSQRMCDKNQMWSSGIVIILEDVTPSRQHRDKPENQAEREETFIWDWLPSGRALYLW